MTAKLIFPRDFAWGAATSAYQIEGAHDADGKGESIWDRFCRADGKIRNGDSGDVACDHYNRWEADIALMKRIGLQTYRFSIAWTRILPDGRGKVNQKGLDFYKRLTDALLGAGIRPAATLYHWDLPQALQDEGGWTNRAVAEAMADYADVVTRELGRGRDEIMWTTHNEPAVAAYIGHWFGVMAPGIEDAAAALQASHHLLLSHGLSMAAIRANCPKSDAGVVLDVHYTSPRDDSPEAYELYRRADGMARRWFLDPVFGRGYPSDMLDDWLANGYVGGRDLGVIKAGDEEIIGAPLDYIGLNYYFSDIAVEADHPQTRRKSPGAAKPPLAAGIPAPTAADERTDMGWNIDPEGLFAVLCRVHFDYRPKAIYITENGCSYGDAPDAQGEIKDARRVSYLKRHLAQAHRAIQEGVPLKGYYVWSLLDNFEWAEGMAQRFGIVWVDFETQERILKESGRWYRDAIAANGFDL